MLCVSVGLFDFVQTLCLNVTRHVGCLCDARTSAAQWLQLLSAPRYHHDSSHHRCVDQSNSAKLVGISTRFEAREELVEAKLGCKGCSHHHHQLHRHLHSHLAFPSGGGELFQSPMLMRVMMGLLC